MIRIAVLVGAVLVSGTSWAADLFNDNITTASHVICVGPGACSMATDQHCAVAIGRNVQFPPHASHILVTEGSTRYLNLLDAGVVEMINREATKYGYGTAFWLGSNYVKEWNRACNIPVS